LTARRYGFIESSFACTYLSETIPGTFLAVIDFQVHSIVLLGEVHSMDNHRSILARKFRKAFREIDYIKAKIHKKQGFLFFKNHVYSVEELLNSEHHGKIYSITEKIGDDAANWYKRGQLGSAGKELYEEKRDEIEVELHQVNLEIMNRQPTWWEEVKGVFTRFVEMVMDNMPDLIAGVLLSFLQRGLHLLPGRFGKILRLGSKKRKILPHLR
jgi:hypothetical protein